MKGIKFVIFLLLIVEVCGSAIATTNILVLDDGYTDNYNSTSKYGTSEYMQTMTGSGQQQYAYVRFCVPTAASSANLKLYCSGYPGGTCNIYRTSPDWTQNILSWNVPPSVEYTTTAINTTAIPTNNTWYTFNVSSAITQPGYYSFRIRSSWGENNRFNSSEATANAPYLEITPTNYTDIITNNKTNNYNRSFLVNTNDCVRFTITPSDITKISNYTWLVNKTDQSNNNPSFNFTVPAYEPNQPSTGIWEIRTVANYTNGTNITREWLISSLNASQAPDFIEYFVDLDNRYRTGYFSDPWGRLPAYYATTTNYIANGFITGTNEGSATTELVTKNFNTTYGTFRFKIKTVPNINTNIKFDVDGDYGSWNYVTDGNGFHDYFAVNNGAASPINGYLPISRRWLGQAPGQHNWKDYGWREITLIHTRDNWWSAWDNGTMIQSNYLNLPDAFRNATSLTLDAVTSNNMDCVEVYKDKYLYPNSKISYGSYPKWWYMIVSSNNEVAPEEEMGIIAFGRNLTLEQISTSINNESLITYNSNTKTATIKTNLFLVSGSDLNITNETLLFDTSSTSLDLNLMMHSELYVYNSTISAIGNNPLRWNLASAVAESVFNPTETRNATSSKGGSLWSEKQNPRYDFGGRFILQNSIINNTCNLFLDGAFEIVLNNTIFSNMSNSNYGSYILRNGYEYQMNLKKQSLGEKAIWITPRNDLASFVVNNISFVNPKITPSFRVTGGEWIFNTTTLENCDLSNVNVSTARAWKIPYFIHYWNLTEHSDLSLLNCKINERNLSVATTYSKLETKYYADLAVKGANGNPINHATITITASNPEYGAENLYKYDYYYGDIKGDLNATGPGQGGASDYAPGYYDSNGTLVGNGANITYSGGAYRRWYNAIPLSSATTNVKGRTSLPSEDVNNSIILTDYVLTNETGEISKQLMEYDLAVNTPNSTSVYLQSVNPDPDWYRKDSSLSAYTITAIIPDTSSKGPHIIGFAPSTENPFNPGDKKTFRVWTDGTLTGMKWSVDRMQVTKDTLNYTWNVTDGSHTIEFSGMGANGTVNQVWNFGGNNASHPRWDVNKDGVVDLQDINIISQYYGIILKGSTPDGDVNQDGVINFEDLILTESHFYETVG